MEEIRLGVEELQLISLFQSVTGASAKDCIIDPRMNRLIIVVNKGEMGLAIGKNGSSIKRMQKLVERPVELVEYSDDPSEFVRNSLNPRLVNSVSLTDKSDGSKVAVVTVDNSKKGAVVGKDGRNAEKARLLAKRYFQIANVLIVS